MFKVIKLIAGIEVVNQYDNFEDAFYDGMASASVGHDVEIHDADGVIENFK